MPFGPATRAQLRVDLERIVDGVTRAHGGSYTCTFIDGYGPVANDPALAAEVVRAVTAVLGDGHLREIPPMMAGDDFSAYQAEVPGVYFIVGAHDPQSDDNYPHHHPRFTIDERAMELATRSSSRSRSRVKLYAFKSGGDYAPKAIQDPLEMDRVVDQNLAC